MAPPLLLPSDPSRPFSGVSPIDPSSSGTSSASGRRRGWRRRGRAVGRVGGRRRWRHRRRWQWHGRSTPTSATRSPRSANLSVSRAPHSITLSDIPTDGRTQPQRNRQETMTNDVRRKRMRQRTSIEMDQSGPVIGKTESGPHTITDSSLSVTKISTTTREISERRSAYYHVCSPTRRNTCIVLMHGAPRLGQRAA